MALRTKTGLGRNGMLPSTGGEEPGTGYWSGGWRNLVKAATHRGFMSNPIERMGGGKGGCDEGGRDRRGVVHGCISTKRRGYICGKANVQLVCDLYSGRNHVVTYGEILAQAEARTMRTLRILSPKSCQETTRKLLANANLVHWGSFRSTLQRLPQKIWGRVSWAQLGN